MKTIYNPEIDFRDQLRRNEQKPRFLFESLTVAGMWVSIQASKYHYCSPQEDLETARGYNSFEVWFDDESDPRGWVDAEELDLLLKEKYRTLEAANRGLIEGSGAKLLGS